MNNPTYFDAVHSLVGGRFGGPIDGPISQFQFDDTVEKGVKGGYTLPTEAEIQIEIVRLQAAYDAQAYARSRKEEYDTLNQFELISDDANNGTTTHKDAVNAIKSKYPKPE